MSTTLGLGSNMFQHAGMDLANDVVRPPMPIRRRPHGVVIPRCAFEPRASARKRGQQELAFLRNKEPVQVRRVDMSIRRQFIERRRTCRDRKSTRLNSSHVSTSYAVFWLIKNRIRRLKQRQG